MFFVAAVLAYFVAAPTVAHAQAADLGTNPRIGGVPVSCAGAHAVAVANMADMAYATNGTIFLRQDFFQIAGILQLFIYAHECGHLVALGRRCGILPLNAGPRIRAGKPAPRVTVKGRGAP